MHWVDSSRSTASHSCQVFVQFTLISMHCRVEDSLRVNSSRLFRNAPPVASPPAEEVAKAAHPAVAATDQEAVTAAAAAAAGEEVRRSAAVAASSPAVLKHPTPTADGAFLPGTKMDKAHVPVAVGLEHQHQVQVGGNAQMAGKAQMTRFQVLRISRQTRPC